MNDNNMNQDLNNAFEYAGQDTGFSIRGVAFKTIIGLIVTVISAVLVIQATAGAPIFVGLGGVFFAMITYAIMLFLLNKLRKGTAFSMLLFFVICAIEGLFAAAALNAFTYVFTIYTSSITPQQIVEILILAAILTVCIVIGCVAMVFFYGEKIRNSKMANLVGKVIIFSLISIGILGLISFFLGMFGFGYFSSLYMEMYFGFGPLGILVSIIFVLAACYMLTKTLIEITQLKGSKVPSRLEYVGAALLVLAIVNLYVEIVRLLLRIAAGNRN